MLYIGANTDGSSYRKATCREYKKMAVDLPRSRTYHYSNHHVKDNFTVYIIAINCLIVDMSGLLKPLLFVSYEKPHVHF